MSLSAGSLFELLGLAVLLPNDRWALSPLDCRWQAENPDIRSEGLGADMICWLAALEPQEALAPLTDAILGPEEQ